MPPSRGYRLLVAVPGQCSQPIGPSAICREIRSHPLNETARTHRRATHDAAARRVVPLAVGKRGIGAVELPGSSDRLPPGAAMPRCVPCTTPAACLRGRWSARSVRFGIIGRDALLDAAQHRFRPEVPGVLRLLRHLTHERFSLINHIQDSSGIGRASSAIQALVSSSSSG